jgi:diadenosine tetraphosphatase ApaH/serine/threonine PP2A family protein phosphatase
MRYIVVSDIHCNAPALESVLQDAPQFDAVLCLGDIVGYGPNPNACVQRIQEFEFTSLAGNHDWGAVGKADLRVFNRDARQALTWTHQELTKANREFLAELPAKAYLNREVLLAHGSPRDPVWEYLVDVASAAQMFRRYEFELLLVGHSHLPLMFEWQPEEERVRPLPAKLDAPLSLEGRRLIVNPGSVGQPRDGNPKASYGLLDVEARTWEFRRTAYPIEITQERMRAKGLPQRLVDRLEIGR